MAAKYPLLRKVRSAAECLFVSSGFNGAYQGANDGGATASAAEYWWGGGTPPGTGLMVPSNDSNTNATLEGYRQPVMADGTTLLWYMQHTGNPSQDQAYLDYWLLVCALTGIRCIAIIYYMLAADLVSVRPGPLPLVEVVTHWKDLYDASPYKHLVRFCMMGVSRYQSWDATSSSSTPVTTGSWLNLPTIAAHWAQMMLDPQYQRDKNGAPFLYIFDDTNFFDATRKTTIDTAVTGVGVPTPTYVCAQNGPGAGAICTQQTAYGPAGNSLTGTQNPYEAQITQDNGNRIPKTLPIQVALTMYNDGRPVRGSGTWWAELPTYTEAEGHLIDHLAFARACSTNAALNGNAVPDNAIFAYGPFEPAEGGMYFPTLQNKQHGVRGSSFGTWGDAMFNVMHRTRPTRYRDWIHGASLKSIVTRVGASWSRVENINRGGGLNPAPWQFALLEGSTAGETVTYAPTTPCERMVLYVTTSPSFNSIQISFDGGAPVTFNQNSVGIVDNVLAFDSGIVAVALHTLKVTIVGGLMNVGKVGVDVVRAVAPP